MSDDFRRAFELIEEIERARDSRVLLLAASHLELDLLPKIFNALRQIEFTDRLDVVISYCRGGNVNCARRIALLLHQFTRELTFIIPHYCQSTGTLLSLGAHQVIAGKLAVFSPIDPHLDGSQGTDQSSNTSLSAPDIKLFASMMSDWFSFAESEAKQKAFDLMTSNIFPPNLTTFYRSVQEVSSVAKELLSYQLPEATAEKKSSIVEALLFKFHSHNYALSGEDMRGLGLDFVSKPDIEELSWDLSELLGSHIGKSNRETKEDGWNDALIASSKDMLVRSRSPNFFSTQWIRKEA